MRMNPRVALVAALTAGLALPGAATAAPLAQAARSGAPRATTTSDTTSTLEAKRSSSVRTPKLDWWKCSSGMDCASVDVPLDYDSPKGDTTEIAVVRIHARDPKNKKGTLFLGPPTAGGSGIDAATGSDFMLNEPLLKSFDIVGFDPRGVGYSDELRCFASAKDRSRALSGLDAGTPLTSEEEQKALTSAKALGSACGTRGKALASSMSTAQTARDMDLLRRAVGEDKLTYLGTGYGSQLGLTYANMYPDRVRAMSLEGAADPVARAGTSATASEVLSARLTTDQAAERVLKEALTRCDATTVKKCEIAGKALSSFEAVMTRLKEGPVVVEEQEDDGSVSTYTYTYSHFIMELRDDLDYSTVADLMMQEIDFMRTMVDRGVPEATRAEALKSLLAVENAREKERRAKAAARKLTGWSTTSSSTNGFPYNNSLEVSSAVVCSDGLHPAKLADWPAAMTALEDSAPAFGKSFGWDSVQCATDTWTAQDEDAYRGPFNRRTAGPVLITNNEWSTAALPAMVQAAADRMPNARLLTTNAWGRDAYTASSCAADAIDKFLIDLTLPASGLTCTDGYQPFTEDLPED